MRIDGEYYIKKTLIPSLDRIFSLVGASVRTWYEDMPKAPRKSRPRDIMQRTSTMHSYIRSRMCPVCKLEETDRGKPLSTVLDSDLCDNCVGDPGFSGHLLLERLRSAETSHWQLQTICADCCGIQKETRFVVTLEIAPLFYSRVKAEAKFRDMQHLESRIFETF
jgi:DNA polymerase zeta